MNKQTCSHGDSKPVRARGLCAYHYGIEWSERTDLPIEHGTLTAYKNRGCRCDLCKRANADQSRKNYERKKAAQ